MMQFNFYDGGRALRITTGIITLALLLLAGGTSASTEIDSCTTISSPGEYKLNKSIINNSISGYSGCINIISSNVIFDGIGHTIDGVDKTLWTYGVHVYNLTNVITNVTVKNLIVTAWNDGIRYENAQNGSINDNIANSNSFGITTIGGSNHTFTNNTANSNIYDGINLGSNNNTLTNNTANSNHNGIYLYFDSNNNILTGNNASLNGNGIWLDSTGNILTSNTAISNYDGIFAGSKNILINNTANSNQDDGITLGSSNILTDNTANSNNNGIYLSHSNNNTITNNIVRSNSYGGIYLFYSSSNNTVTNNTANSNGYGIYLYIDSNNNTITSNSANLNSAGISLSDSSNNNILKSNNVNLNTNGIQIFNYASNNIITNNTVNSYNYGIYLYSYSSNNTIQNNTVNSNDYGIRFWYSSNNILTNNTVKLNDYNGIYLESSNNNIIYNNYFNNTNNAFDNGNNTWNINKTSGTNIINGAFLGGNFWSDYAGNDTDGDGLGNTMLPYNSSGGIANGGDYLPLIFASTPGYRAPNITSFFPTTSIVTNNVGDSRTFSITVNQTVNITWLINGTQVQKNNSVTAASYTNTSAALGMWNVSVRAQNANGGDMQTWIWNVTQPIIGNGSISGFKINDTNSNGKWDSSDKGISNWTIRLVGIIGKGKDAKVIRKETATDAQGFYMFDNLSTGRYIVIEKLKKGFVPTSSPVKRIKLAQGENSMNNNFTNRLVHTLARIDGQKDIDYYEVINRDIDKYKEEMD